MKQVNTPTAPSVVLTEINYQQVLNMAPEDQEKLMKGFHNSTARLAETRDEVKLASKYASILLAGAEARVKKGIEARVYSSTFTASDLYKQVTGEKPPGHVWTMKNCFVNYVLTGLIAETDFIGNRNNCLEIAQKICDAVFEKAPEAGLQHEAVSRAANELKTRNDNEAKVLRGILDSVKPAKLMTDKQAMEAFAEIVNAGHFGMVLVGMTPEIALTCFERVCLAGHLPVTLAQLPENVTKLEEAMQKDAYVAMAHSAENLDKALGSKVDAWTQEASNAVQIKNLHANAAPAAETPAPAPETPPADAVTAPEITLNLVAA